MGGLAARLSGHILGASAGVFAVDAVVSPRTNVSLELLAAIQDFSGISCILRRNSRSFGKDLPTMGYYEDTGLTAIQRDDMIVALRRRGFTYRQIAPRGGDVSGRCSAGPAAHR